MKSYIIVCIVFLASVSNSFSNEFFWGKTGHRVVGEIASKYLTRKAQKSIDELLQGESLAMASTFADEIKSDSKYRKFNPWHYVNIPEGKTYNDITPKKEGDIIQAIEFCKQVIVSENHSKEDKRFYLKLLIHFIGDLHQPLHAGREEDKGGNDIQVRWFNNGSNLHRVWDENMLDFYEMSYTELADNLTNLPKRKIKKLQEGTILDWLTESHQLAISIYSKVQPGQKLRYDYMYYNFDTVKNQLLKGGVRLAKVLNELFK